MGQAVIDGTFEAVGNVSEVWYDDVQSCFISVKNLAGGGQVVVEHLPAGAASKENDSWTTDSTINADQAPSSFTETTGRKYRMRCTALGTKGIGYRMQHGAAADQNSIAS